MGNIEEGKITQKVKEIIYQCQKDNIGHTHYVLGKEPLLSPPAVTRFNSNLSFYLTEMWGYHGKGTVCIRNIYYVGTDLYIDGYYETPTGKQKDYGYLWVDITTDEQLYHIVRNLEVMIPKYYVKLVIEGNNIEGVSPCARENG